MMRVPSHVPLARVYDSVTHRDCLGHVPIPTPTARGICLIVLVATLAWSIPRIPSHVPEILAPQRSAAPRAQMIKAGSTVTEDKSIIARASLRLDQVLRRARAFGLSAPTLLVARSSRTRLAQSRARHLRRAGAARRALRERFRTRGRVWRVWPGGMRRPRAETALGVRRGSMWLLRAARQRLTASSALLGGTAMRLAAASASGVRLVGTAAAVAASARLTAT